MMRWRTYAAVAAMLAFLAVMLAGGLGCGPAAPAGQGGDAAKVDTAGTPGAFANLDDGGWDELGEPPPTPTFTPMERQYPILSGYFIDAIRRYEAAVAAAEGSGGGQQTPGSRRRLRM